MTLTTTTDKPTVPSNTIDRPPSPALYVQATAEILIKRLRGHRPELIHYAGAAHRDAVAAAMCDAYMADPSADEATLKSRALKAAWGWNITPEQIRAANPGMR